MTKPRVTVVCWDCDKTWDAADGPMTLGRIAALLRGLHCPQCGAGSESIGLAPGELMEFEDRWDNE